MPKPFRAKCEKCGTDMYYGPVGDAWYPYGGPKIEKYLCVPCCETIGFTEEGTLTARDSPDCWSDYDHISPPDS